MNYDAVCRAAPATPGMLVKGVDIVLEILVAKILQEITFCCSSGNSRHASVSAGVRTDEGQGQAARCEITWWKSSGVWNRASGVECLAHGVSCLVSGERCLFLDVWCRLSGVRCLV